MVGSRTSATSKRSFRALVIFPLVTTGFALTCAAVCLSPFAVLAIAFKVGGHHDAESRPPTAQLKLPSGLRTSAAAAVADVPGRPRQGAQQGIQLIRFDAATLAPMAFTQFCLKYPGDCKSGRLLLDGDRIELNEIRRSELEPGNR